MAALSPALLLLGISFFTPSAPFPPKGRGRRGFSVLGLRRGFRLAGAENIISTLWPIADRATVILMQEFYEGLAAAPPQASLSATQRKWLVALRDKSDVKDDDPIPAGGFYWAVNLAGPFLLGR